MARWIFNIDEFEEIGARITGTDLGNSQRSSEKHRTKAICDTVADKIL